MNFTCLFLKVRKAVKLDYPNSCIVRYLQLKEINSRLNRIEPKVPTSDGTATHHKVAASRSVSVNPKRGSPRTKSTPRESTLFGGKLYIFVRSLHMIIQIYVFAFNYSCKPRRSITAICQSRYCLGTKRCPFSMFIWVNICECPNAPNQLMIIGWTCT